MTYFKKSLVFNPVYLKSGKVEWTRVGKHDGVLATEDADTIASLTKLATERRMGVVVITEEEYEDLKKNPYVAPSLTPYRLPGLPSQPPLPPNPATAAASSPEPKVQVRKPRSAKPSTSKGVLAKS